MQGFSEKYYLRETKMEIFAKTRSAWP